MKTVAINYIWKYRNKKRFGQKRAAYLLGHSASTQFSAWERSQKLPNLQNALKLAYILEVPVEVLFEELYQDLRKDVDERQVVFAEEV